MNQIGPGSPGPPQAPKKSVTISEQRTIMLMYSATWKAPQRIPPNSVW